MRTQWSYVPMVIAIGLAGAMPAARQIQSTGIRIQASAQPLTTAESAPAALSRLRALDNQVTGLVRAGALARTAAVVDPLVAGRTHERYVQTHSGVRVFGGGLTRQVNGFGQAESLLGTYYADLDADTIADLPQAAARARLAAVGRGVIDPDHDVQLSLLPDESGQVRLAWVARVMSADDGLVRRVFLDADSGAVLLNYVDVWTQFAVGRGTGVLGDDKKVIALPTGGSFLAVDQARPRADAFDLPAGHTITFDLRGNLNRWLSLGRPTTADIAADADNVWTDAGVVDAHVHTGLTYDYVFRRFGRNGVDGHSRQVWSFLNLVRPEDHVLLYGDFPNYFTNAAYVGGGRVYYGAGLPPGVVRGGRTWVNLAGALDVVAHELTHVITDFTSDLIYLNESGALNEAFSDIIGASVEWFYQPPGTTMGTADWLIGEDVARPRGFRSMSDPASYGAPDHYSRRVTGSSDNGGVHTNSSIVNHMYYLAVNGGVHRRSGVAVTGIGFANRDRAERIVFRAFTTLMPAGASFATARAATILAAQDLYGAGSPEAIAFAQAWTAVGVE